MLDRRHFLGICVGSGAMAISDRLSAAQDHPPGRIAFRLRETGGLRRFSYPVHAMLPARVRMGGPDSHFRLLLDGKEVPAQFRETGPRSARSGVALDFSASPGPFETQEYVVEFGAAVKPAPGASRGLTTGHADGLFRVATPPHLTYAIPDDLAGFVSSISTPDLEYLSSQSRGLYLIDRESGARTALIFPRRRGATIAEWTRKGPFAVGLRFDGTISSPGGKPFRTAVDLTFVASKSWIEASWIVEDPEDRLDILGLDLELKLDGKPTLVDCGASSTVYSHLRGVESLAFTGRPMAATDEHNRRWIVEQGEGANLRPFAVAPLGDRAAEGWVHIMDRSRCSALAVADFGLAGTDRFLIESRGRASFERRFAKAGRAADPNGRKSLKFWLHVVPMPVQIGAVTSPQAMLAPLVVDWIE